jgi:hypothetical protein
MSRKIARSVFTNARKSLREVCEVQDVSEAVGSFSDFHKYGSVVLGLDLNQDLEYIFWSENSGNVLVPLLSKTEYFPGDVYSRLPSGL